ncbi:MAG: GTP cyclohydrolase I, partial [Trebonia sp.]
MDALIQPSRLAAALIGIAHIGYLSAKRIKVLSELARVVGMFACPPRVQGRLTRQVAAWLHEKLEPLGTGVITAARHPPSYCRMRSKESASGRSYRAFAGMALRTSWRDLRRRGVIGDDRG